MPASTDNNDGRRRRKSVHLNKTAYQRGCFFVTLCCEGRQRRFGRIVDGEMHLNALGTVARDAIDMLPRYIAGLRIVCHVVMPDHVHFMAYLGDGATKSLSEVITAYKKRVIHLCAEICSAQGCDLGSLWQRNYYEHIVSDSDETDKIRAYICNNPAKWQAEGKG